MSRIKYSKVNRLLPVLVVLVCLIAPSALRAEMRSQNYIIHENVNQEMSGPAISAVSHSASGQSATITWTTDVPSDSYVVYSTDSGLAGAKEQGYSAQDKTSHSVTLSSLAGATRYYYRVRSQRVNGGSSTSDTTRSFTTEALPTSTTTVLESSSGGGGVLIIDKTDKRPPAISEVGSTVSGRTATITWRTDESATAFVEFGLAESFGETRGTWATGTAHRVVLSDLSGNSSYFYRVLSSDSWGNYAYSQPQSFLTGPADPDEVDPDQPSDPDNPVTDAARSTMDFLRRIFPELSGVNLDQRGLDALRNSNDLSALALSPVFGGAPRVTATANSATVTWQTNIDANTQLALATEADYNSRRGERYTQVIGDFEARTRNHSVRLFNLAPDTVYHYQVRGKVGIGRTITSLDFTFRTQTEGLRIMSFQSDIVDDGQANFRWVTNKEADSMVRITPFRGNVLAVEEAKVIRDSRLSALHEITVPGLIGGVLYEIELSSRALDGKLAVQVLPNFSTKEDTEAPLITAIKTDSTIFVDRGNKIQTIISWLTDEPATGRVFFQEGVQLAEAELTESTALDENYSREHIQVITKFKPGTVYSFRVESIDSRGNRRLSDVHTFMSAKKKESILQIIISVLENTFGWLKKLR